jgi:hypothetical protein
MIGEKLARTLWMAFPAPPPASPCLSLPPQRLPCKTTQIRKGGEVTVSYLDQLAMAPLETRRGFLQGAYGFRCNCYRCKVSSE